MSRMNTSPGSRRDLDAGIYFQENNRNKKNNAAAAVAAIKVHSLFQGMSPLYLFVSNDRKKSEKNRDTFRNEILCQFVN